MKIKSSVALLAAFALVGSLFSVVAESSTPAVAATANQFSAGNIISDALFFNGSAMTAAQVQSFLSSQVSMCSSGYVCLKDYSQATQSRAAVAGRCTAYTGASSESAATIIARVGAACNISQKVLIVLLEKEQSLVSSSSPSSTQYRSATGYGCPDTSACDSTYYGFFNQVYAAALQFETYAANPTAWSHVPGRLNYVAYNPSSACGGTNVFIQNQATAGLYNYTPYQPNTAALANLYGTGDSCSAYGNRNFWRLYTDWFGATTAGSSLARTVDNSTVYVISGTVKYAVPNLALLGSLAPLGVVGYVSQSYLDGFSTGPNASRIIRGPDGSIYFFDSGIKLPFGDCTMVANYGGSCASTGYMQLTDAQVAAFQTGPLVSQVLGTAEGARYYINAGTKREILDDQSQTAAGIPLGYNVLTENAVAYLPLGAPIIRDGAFAGIRGTSQYTFLSSGTGYAVAASAVESAGLPSRSAGSLWPASVALIPASSQSLTGVVRVTGSATNILLAGTGSYQWTGAVSASIPVIPASQAFVDTYPLQGTIAVGEFVKSSSSSTVYVVTSADVRPIASWGALLSLTPSGTTPNIVTVPSALISAMPQGIVALTAGSLVRSPDNATIYVVNGITSRIPVSTFDTTAEAGIVGFSVVSDSVLSDYPVATSAFGYGVTCGEANYVSAAGELHAVAPSSSSLYPVTYTPLDSYTCAVLKVGSPATQFIRTVDGSIYQLVAGQKRPIGSMARYAALGGTPGGWLSVSSGFAAVIPSGAAA